MKKIFLIVLVSLSLISFLLPNSFANISITTTHKIKYAPTTSTSGSFAFVSNFEDMQLDGWIPISGSIYVTNVINYLGEPVLVSKTKGNNVQVSIADSGFVQGDQFLSFQVLINAEKGVGFFGLYAYNYKPVAIVGISNGYVYAGSDLNNLKLIEKVPQNTAYPNGWVYIAANVYNASTPSNPNEGWIMQVFVDRTDQIAATFNVPNAYQYSGAIILTLNGIVYYTNIVVSTYEIPIYIPGYNNMEGYGQGSGLLVQLLPAFYKLSAEMILFNWSTPQVGILSFQINAMNYYGATRSSCVGFFQLGIDLNPNGTIAPWYVPGKNCIAHYFLQSQNPAVQSGFVSPMPTHLFLSIIYNMTTDQIEFYIKDVETNSVFIAYIPYNGTAFYGTYTQLEFQPCCNLYPISYYKMNGELINMQITTLDGKIISLPASYMLPFTLDAPPTWNFAYYQNSTAGYQQIST